MLKNSTYLSPSILKCWKTQHIYHLHYRFPQLSLDAEKPQHIYRPHYRFPQLSLDAEKLNMPITLITEYRLFSSEQETVCRKPDANQPSSLSREGHTHPHGIIHHDHTPSLLPTNYCMHNHRQPAARASKFMHSWGRLTCSWVLCSDNDTASSILKSPMTGYSSHS